jgi:hypothetical protein
MLMIPATLWTAVVTLGIGAFYFCTAFRVGNLRGKHKIQAPATSGHPEFDRASLGVARAADRAHMAAGTYRLFARLYGRSQQTIDRCHARRLDQHDHADHRRRGRGAGMR